MRRAKNSLFKRSVTEVHLAIEAAIRYKRSQISAKEYKVAKRRRGKQFFSYECSITGRKFKRTRKIDKTDELICVSAFYDLQPDMDDRPDHIKAQIVAAEEERAAMEALFEANAEVSSDIKKL